MDKKIVITSCFEDQEFAFDLYSDLTKKNYKVWLDKEGIVPGDNIQTAFMDALHDSTHCLVVLSNFSFTKKGHSQKELSEIMNMIDKFTLAELVVIPILKDNCKVHHPVLSQLYSIDFSKSYNEGIRLLYQILDPKTYVEPSSPWSRNKKT